MNEAHHYQVKVTWLEDRKGLLQSDILEDQITVVTPPEFTKGVAGKWSPEHLFVAAVSSCFMTTFLAIAEKSKLEFNNFSCNAVGTLERTEGQFSITQITLHPVLSVFDSHTIEKGLKVLALSEKACLITNSIKSEIIFAPQIIVDHHTTTIL